MSPPQKILIIKHLISFIREKFSEPIYGENVPGKKKNSGGVQNVKIRNIMQ